MLESSNPAPSLPWVQMESVQFGYHKNQLLLADMNLQLLLGQCTALVGSNGSGKTTLGKLIAGLLRPWQGCIRLQGQESSRLNLGQIGQKVGYLFQEPDRQLFAPTVWDEMVFPNRLAGTLSPIVERRAADLLLDLGLDHLRQDFPQNLSRGEKQRLAVAAILMQEPRFLVLDEPTTGLDHERRQQLSTMVQTFRDQGVGLLVISHDQRFVENNADRILTMVKGEITSDEIF